MIESVPLFALAALLLWGWRANRGFTRRALAEGRHAYAVVRELRRETMRYYAYVDYFGLDGTSTLRWVEYRRKDKDDLPFHVGQVVEVIDYRQRLYWLPQLQSSADIFLLLAAGSLLWALIQLYNDLV